MAGRDTDQWPPLGTCDQKPTFVPYLGPKSGEWLDDCYSKPRLRAAPFAASLERSWARLARHVLLPHCSEELTELPRGKNVAEGYFASLGGAPLVPVMNPPTCGIATTAPHSAECTGLGSGESLASERCVRDS
jgi:hypothetical protein